MILLCLLLIPVSTAQPEVFSEKNAYEHIRILSEEIGPRVAGGENATQAYKYIETEFNKYNLSVHTQEFEFNTRFNETEKWTKHKGEKRIGKNIIGILKGKSDKRIIISSHYDSVNCPGANDDASGVGVMLEIARVLAAEKHDKTIVFIAFDAEEHMLSGSEYYVANLNQKDTNNTLGVLNLDSIGRGDFLMGFIWERVPKSKYIFGGYSSPMDFVKPIYTGNSVSPGIFEQLKAFMFDDFNHAYVVSDHSSFIDDKFYKKTGKIIPSVCFTFIEKGELEVTLPNTAASHIPDLHSENDTFDKIEIKNLKIVGEVVMKSVNKLDNLDSIKKEPDTSFIFKIGSKVFGLPYWSILFILIILPLLISVFLFMKEWETFALFVSALPYLTLNFIYSQDPHNIKISGPIFLMIFSLIFLFGRFHSNDKVKKICTTAFLLLLLSGSLPSLGEIYTDVIVYKSTIYAIGLKMELVVAIFIIVLTVLSTWEYAHTYVRRCLK